MQERLTQGENELAPLSATPKTLSVDRHLKGAAVMSSISPSSDRPMHVVPSKILKLAIVTGASSGIGLEAVRRLVASGYPSVANCRNITSGNTLDGTSRLKPVDREIGIAE